MKKILIITSLIAVSACQSTVPLTPDQIARRQAKSVVNGIVKEKMPGVKVSYVTDCIIDAASASEIVEIGSASVTGVTSSTVSQVFKIAGRQDSVNCIAQNSATLLGG